MPTYDVMVDIDDCIYPWSATAHELCVIAGITNGKEIRSWHFWEDYGCTEDDLWEVLRLATESGELYVQSPYAGALAQLRRLQYAGHRVHIVTARGFGPNGEQVQALTREWIRRENVAHDSLTFAKRKTEVGIDFHFALDDGTHNYEDLAEAGVLVSLMNQRHNQSFTHHNGLPVRRVDSVRQFVDQVLEAEAAQMEVAAA